MSAAPAIADQINPYVADPGNFFHYGAALVFQWKLDFPAQAARIRYAEAQLEEVRAQQRFALGGVGAEVEVAYAEVLDWKKRVERLRQGRQDGEEVARDGAGGHRRRHRSRRRTCSSRPKAYALNNASTS